MKIKPINRASCVRKQQRVDSALGVRVRAAARASDAVVGSGYVVARRARAVLPAQFKATELAQQAKVDGQALFGSGLRDRCATRCSRRRRPHAPASAPGRYEVASPTSVGNRTRIRRQLAQAQIVDFDRASAAAAAGGDDELDASRVSKRAVLGRAPGERDLPSS